MRQLSNEAHRVAEERVLVGRQIDPARGGIERGEEFVLGQNLRSGERVEQCRLAGIRVTHDGRQWPLTALAALALCLAHAFDLLQIAPQFGDSFLNAAAIHFELALAIASHSDAAFLPRKVRPQSREARQDMLQLRHLDLHFAFPRASSLGEDIEDERGAIEYLAIEHTLEIARLGWRKFVIENNGVDVALFTCFCKFACLAFADVCCGMGAVEALGAFSDDLRAGGSSEFCQFCHRFREVCSGTFTQFRAN